MSRAIPTIPSIAERYVPKVVALMHDILNERRLLKPQVRRPGSDHWEDITWDQAYRRDRPAHQEDARRNIRRQPTRRAAPSTAAKASPGTADAPTLTSSTISS